MTIKRTQAVFLGPSPVYNVVGVSNLKRNEPTSPTFLHKH
jgi:hypothetical protein